MTLAPLLLTLLTGCDELGLDKRSWLEDSGGVKDTAEPLPALRIDSLAPDWGPTSGGTAVTITGAGFDATSAVYFGGSELTVSYLNEYTLAVTSPAAAVETSVDVTVESALGETVLAGGYSYSDSGDPTPDTGDSGGGGTSPTGMVGGVVEFWYQAYFCAECFGLTSQLQVAVNATFHPEVSGSWHDWVPENGSCFDSYNYVPPTSTATDLGEWAYFTSGASSIPLHRSTVKGLVGFESDPLAQDDYIRNSSYDLDVTEAGLSLEGVVQTATGFDDFTPIEMAQTTIQTAFSAPISASNATVGWAPSGTSADMLVVLEIFHPQTSALSGMILCRDTDTGSITIPSSLLLSGAYYADSPLVISFYRVIFRETVSPLDGSTIEGATFYGGIGTGILVP
jgi:hypothetical protein